MQVLETFLFLALISGVSSFLIEKKGLKFIASTLLLCAGISTYFSQNQFYVFGNFSNAYGIEHSIGGISFFLVETIIISGILTIFQTKDNFSLGFVIIAIVSGIFVFITKDIFNFYIFFELFNICLILLFSKTENKIIKKNVLDYLLLSGISAGFIVIGIEIIYIVFKTLNVSLIAELSKNIDINQAKLLKIATVFIVVGSFIKMGIFPFSSWIKKIYTSVPNYLLVFYGTIASQMAIYIVLFFFYIVLKNAYLIEFARNIITPFAVFGMILFSFLATKERDLRIVMAYSTIAQIGYICVALLTPNAQTISGALFNIIHNFIIKFGLFVLIFYLGKDKNYNISILSKIGKNYTITIPMAIVIASLIGVPLTSGFVVKYEIFQGLIQEKQIFSLIGLIISSIFAIIYCWKMIVSIFFEKSEERVDISYIPQTIIIIVAFVTIFFGFASEIFIDKIQIIAISYLQSLNFII